MSGFTSRLCSLPLVLGRPVETLKSKPAVCFYTTTSHGAYLSVVQLAYQCVPHKYFFLCLRSFRNPIFSTPFTFSVTFFFYYPRSIYSWLKVDIPGSRLSATPKTVLFKYFSPCFRKKPRNWKFFLCLKQNGFPVSDVMAPTRACFWRTFWLDQQGTFPHRENSFPQMNYWHNFIKYILYNIYFFYKYIIKCGHFCLTAPVGLLNSVVQLCVM